MSEFNHGLGTIFMLSDSESRSISAENPDGSKGGGAREIPDPASVASDLGTGWKVRPCITLQPGETVTLADITGPGTLAHLWMTVEEKAYRSCILRFYWDGEEEASVEVPLGDFFCCGHAMRCKVDSLPIAVNPSGGFNSYWPMPFRKSARITLENQWMEEILGFYYQIDYRLEPVPDGAGYFHAQWRRENPLPTRTEYTILDGVHGKGHYAGVYLAWAQLSTGWWGEGEIKFYIDGDGENPTICGTGTEDYFGGAWGFGDTYSTAFLGYPFWHKAEGEVPKHGLYRWHIMDPVHFHKDLSVTIQDLGWWPNGKFQPNTDDIASVAYWYQTEPHGEFPELRRLEERFPR